MSSDDTITVCPECDAPDIRRRQPGTPVGTSVDAQWHCRACDARFDDPAERAPDADGTRSTSGLAHALAVADSIDEALRDYDDTQWAADGDTDGGWINGELDREITLGDIVEGTDRQQHAHRHAEAPWR